MPFADHVMLELDGKNISVASKRLPWAIEVGGKFCTVVAESIDKGERILRSTMNATSPEHVLFFSHHYYLRH